jgi:septal ring factor EnvC (AmiA/AmiB activator)
MAAKKAPAKAAPKKTNKTGSAAQFRMKEEADKKKMARTDARGNSGMGFSYPRQGKVDRFWGSTAGKAVIATNPLLGTAALISAGERRVRKKLNPKAYTDE